MGLFQNFKKADEILENKLDTVGYFTPADIEAAGFGKWFVNFLVFMMKRDSEYTFFYLDPMGEKIESKYDVPKEKRDSLTLCFQPQNDHNYSIR
jgi:hypothetical protein